jgi:hypothetical protein
MIMKAQSQTRVNNKQTFSPASTGLLQRTKGPGRMEEECRGKRQMLQRYSKDHSEISEIPPIVYDVLRSPGEPLDMVTRSFMEPRFGHDFSRVRVHTDAKAAESAHEVNALAYTVGRDIVFGPQSFAPHSHEGQKLLAHELTHIVQQADGGASPGSAQERDAKEASRAVETGQRPQVQEPSRVGLAAQPRLGFPGAASLEEVEPGLRIVKRSDIEARVKRIIKAPGHAVVDGRADFNASPARAKANLYHTHFRNDDERLSYALGVFQQFLGIEGGGVDPNELFVTLVNYEVQVQEPSRVGLAAQPRLGFPGAASLEEVEPGLRIVKRSDIEATVKRVIKTPGAQAAQARSDFNASPGSAKANLLHSHFRDDNERLSYALGFFRQVLGVGGSGVDANELFATLVGFETQMQTQEGAVVVHTPPTRAEQRLIAQAQAAQARREYQAYLAEVARLNKEACARTVACSGVYSGAANVGLYERYVGPPVEALAEALKEEAAPMASMMLNFVPILGQVKGLIEGIIGKDLITGEELPNWVRGLNILLAIIPVAHGLASAGEDGVRVLARVAVDSGQDVDKVYRVAKVASRLSEEEVQAAEKAVAGTRPTAVQVKIAKSLQEMEGVATKPVPLEPIETVVAKGLKSAAAELENIKRTTRLAGKPHTLTFKRIGNRLTAWLCSNGCGELVAKARAMISRLPKKDPARGDLWRFINKVEKEATWIDVAPEAERAQQKLEELRKGLEEIQARYPDAIKPDLPPEPSTGVPEPISEEAPTQPIRAGEEVGEIVEGYRISGEKGLRGDTFERDILGLTRLEGPTNDIRFIMKLFGKFLQEARAAGATRLRITGNFIRNQNVLRIRRLAEALGGTATVTGSMSNEIIIPLR